MEQPGKLTFKTKVGYGIGDWGGNLFFTIIGFWLMNYLTDEVGLSAAYAGIALMIGRICDAFFDPVIGTLSDRTNSRWGRRRSWMLFASFPLFVAIFFLFRNPGIASQQGLFIWAAVVYSLACIFYACVNIPYNALTPELTKNFHEKTTLNGYRMTFAVVGTLTGAGLALPLINGFSNKTTGYMVMGLVFGLVILITALIPVITVKEPHVDISRNKESVFRQYLDAFRNKPFLTILIPWSVNIAGVTIVQASMIYYFKYVLFKEANMTLALVIMLVTSMIFIPVCVKVSKYIGKSKTYIIGIIIICCTILTIFLCGHKLSIQMIYLLMLLTGLGFSAHYVMPWAMVPDTIEYDYLKSGVRREGIYYSLWVFTIKLGQAFANLCVGLILGWFGYIADPGAIIQKNTTTAINQSAVLVYDNNSLSVFPGKEQSKSVALLERDSRNKSMFYITPIQGNKDVKVNNIIIDKKTSLKNRDRINYKASDILFKSEQSPKAILGIRLLIGPFTLIFYLIGVIVLAFYPINKKMYEEIQRQIKLKEDNI